MIECKVGGCTNPVASSPGWCTGHYHRWRRYGDPEYPDQRYKAPVSCKVDGCSTRASSRGWCEHHYNKWRNNQDPEYQRKDSVTYEAVHMRLRRNRGLAKEFLCTSCGQDALDWSYDHSDPNEITAIVSGVLVRFSPDLQRYQPLCRSCHKKLDRGNRPKARDKDMARDA